MNRIVFDIGGTHMRIAHVINAELTDIKKTKTPQNPDEGVAVINDYIKCSGVHFEEVVGGVAGFIKDGVVIFSEHLPKWGGFDIASEIKKESGAHSVQIFNDAEIAGIGESRTGAGKKYNTVAYVVFSTGVGGALIVNGEPVAHAGGYEPGKQVIDYKNMQSLEDAVCGASLEKEFGDLPQNLSSEIFRKRTHVLAVGLYNVLCLWSPDVLVVGGALINEKNGYSLDDVINDVSELSISMHKITPIVHAGLLDTSGLVGAMLI
ncbi:hypothetical protein MNBD_CPR01-568 [hydrothermal vent metagenome]|uniref:ROK family protein n=1 Tax=hydrothermal vent metagenome TaxID=652676 RepID=A0A3B0UYV5_9ZZZZ